MIQAVICDDSVQELNNINRMLQQIIETSGVHFVVQTYTNGEQLLKNIISEEIDLLLLDIDMPGISGIEVAEKIRQENLNIDIIFVTNHNDLVFQSIHYQPFRFVRKDQLKEDLVEAILSYIKKKSKEERLIIVNQGVSKVSVKLTEVLYIESNKHYITYYMENGDTVRTRGSLNKLEQDYKNNYFLRTHAGYLVNPKYVYTIEKTKVMLTDKETIPVSRHRLEDIKHRYQQYARSERG